MHSVNFVTCHDGFTLWDLVSYNFKHNEANGEENRDGSDQNFSWNCGSEGPTDDPEVLALRRRQVRNLMTTLLLSQGVPMLLAGDELLRSQLGNNNAWCQDNPLSWVDWELAETNADFLRFMRALIAFRKRHPALRRRQFLQGAGPDKDRKPDIIWHGVKPGAPDFSAKSKAIAYVLDGTQTGREPDRDFYVACNAYSQAVAFGIPPAPTRRPWFRVVDTALQSPDDFVDATDGLRVPVGCTYLMAPFSMLILMTAS
jgi:glycogen operon protein